MTPKTFEWSDIDGELVTHCRDVKISANELPGQRDLWTVAIRWQPSGFHSLRVDGFWQVWKMVKMLAELLDRKPARLMLDIGPVAQDRRGAPISTLTPVKYFDGRMHQTHIPSALVAHNGRMWCAFEHWTVVRGHWCDFIACEDVEVQSVWD